MIQIKKNNVLIPITIWNELKKDAYLIELIELLEDSELLEKTKKESKGFIDFDVYIREREQKEKHKTSKLMRKNLKKKKLVV